MAGVLGVALVLVVALEVDLESVHLVQLRAGSTDGGLSNMPIRLYWSRTRWVAEGQSPSNKHHSDHRT